MTTVDHVRNEDREWQALGTHGLRCKTLSADMETGARLNLVDIPKGWRGGGVAHFHEAFEEVYIIDGSVTLGAGRWLRSQDYLYRPAQVVHGHDERSEEGCLCLIRSDGAIALNLIHEPVEPDEYPRIPLTDERGHVLHLETATVAWSTVPELPRDWAIKALSRNPVTGAFTAIAKVPAGWSSAEPQPHPASWSAYVLDGAIDADGAPFVAGDFATGPASRGLMGPSASAAGCTLIFWFDARD